MDYPKSIARVTTHIPDRGQVLDRHSGLSADARRGKVRQADRVPVGRVIPARASAAAFVRRKLWPIGRDIFFAFFYISLTSGKSDPPLLFAQRDDG
ncbi:MAG: hypothetical protein OEW18_01930 [Candidatus Aminicenantes bacterium]|nr:hypothetical protein [Candidatus Aminicenantes bacterium]